MRQARAKSISAEEEQILLEFARSLRGDLSPASIAAYQSDIRLFAEGIPSINLLGITPTQENAYLQQLRDYGSKPRTIQRKGTALRYFREFLAKGRPLAKPNLRFQAKAHSGDALKSVPEKLALLKVSVDPLDQGIYDFIQSLRGLSSQSTIRAYVCDLLKLRQFLMKRAKFDEITRDTIADFIDEQVSFGLNANSVARTFSAIRSLFNWLQKHRGLAGC
jgi:site-specific recombinase XerD